MSETTNKPAVQVQNVSADIKLDGNVFSGWHEFQAAGKMAAALSQSTIVPRDYQKNPGNCLIALDMASRMGTSPMMVMQNLYIVNGRPAWSTQYIVAMINSSRKYKTELQYDLTGSGDTLECTAWVLDKNGHKVTGPTITMQMAKEEGWYGKNGSKWKTMPEVMIRYRAASFFGRLNCPDMMMGIYSTDEVIEMSPDQYSVVDAEVKQKANQQPLDIKPEQIDQETGEVKEPQAPAEKAKKVEKKLAEKGPAKLAANANDQQTFDPGF